MKGRAWLRQALWCRKITTFPATTMKRSILSVIVGYLALVIGALVVDLALGALMPGWHGSPDQPPPGFHRVLYVLYTTVFSIVGGYLAAFLARRSARKHALAVGVIAFVFSLPPVVSNWGGGLTWPQLSVPFLVLSGALLGGYLRLGRARKKPHDAGTTEAMEGV